MAVRQKGRRRDQGNPEGRCSQEGLIDPAPALTPIVVRAVEWFVLAIRAQRYRAIIEKLSELDVEVYYPMRTVWRKQRTGPRIRKDYPLMPSYIFVGTRDLEPVHRPILSIDGSLNFLGVGDRPSVCDIDQLTRIRACEAAGNYDETLARIEQMLVGRSMTITEGPFATYSGVVTSVADGRVELDITILGRATAIKINVDNLE